eukprot:334304_1
MARACIFQTATWSEWLLMIKTGFQLDFYGQLHVFELLIIFALIFGFYLIDIWMLFKFIIISLLLILLMDVIWTMKVSFIMRWAEYVSKHYPKKFALSQITANIAYNHWIKDGKSCQCPICYQSFTNDSKSILLKCGHRFCVKCINKQNETNEESKQYVIKCALCRRINSKTEWYDFEDINANLLTSFYVPIDFYGNPFKIKFIRKYIIRYSAGFYLSLLRRILKLPSLSPNDAVSK